jgi:YD repeat-containing protein
MLRPVYSCTALVLALSPMMVHAQKSEGTKASLFSPAPSQTEISKARVFGEPLIAVGEPTPEETRALARAIDTYLNAGRNEVVEPFFEFLKAHPTSAWRASLLLNLGLVYRQNGFFSRALEAWEEVWKLRSTLKDSQTLGLADRAGAELADLYACLSRTQQLEKLLQELAGRPLRGSAATKLRAARGSLDRVKANPEHGSHCGPQSLATYQRALGRPMDPKLLDEHGAPSGTSLSYNQRLGQKYGLDLQMAKREPGAPLLLPAILHWKSGHFSTVTRKNENRYLLEDPAFGGDLWVPLDAIEDEATGFALVAKGPLPAGWQAVPPSEGMKVMGRICGSPCDQDATGKDDSKEGDNCNKGMAGYAFHSLLASLYVSDIPVGYAPPKGPAVEFLVSYSQKEANQPQVFTYSNLGPRWTFDFLAFIQDDPTLATDTQRFFMTVKAYERGGGAKYFTFQNADPCQPPSQPSSGPSLPHRKDQSVLYRSGLSSYARVHPDGRQELYEWSDGARTFPRRIFLTKIIDRLGSALTIQYDSQNRVVALVDTLGKTTTLAYELASDPLKITKVTDPFGRSARFEYNAEGQLQRITDVVGITSEFAYGPTTSAPENDIDFMHALTTPYGTTQFLTGTESSSAWIESINPKGGRKRLEFKRRQGTQADTSGKVPPGFANYHPVGTFYWDERVMELYPGNYDKAKYTRWVVDTSEGYIDVPYCIKPAESLDAFTTWFAYPGQPATNFAGTLHLPSRILRTLGDGRFQESRFEYNSLGRPTKTTDPLGRETSYTYAENGLDLLEVRQTSHGRNQLLAKYTYNAQHLPLTATDASGQTTLMVYNPAGQVTGITNPKGQTVSMVYNGLGQLTDVNGIGGQHSGFTYDAVGRVQSITNPEHETIATEYDPLDRPTRIDYPDGTFEQIVYDRLDPALRRDRGGKWTLMTYNALRQLVEVQDALGRVTRLDWCSCGTLDSLTDPLGQTTNWLRDLSGRVIGKILPDRSATEYVYDLLGRLVQRRDSKHQITKYAYNDDDTLAQISYTNTLKPASPISYTYDPDFNRLVSMTDKTGTTTYTYHPITDPPTLGAGRLATETSPMAQSTVTYGYDELGRVVSQDINGSASQVGFDTLGRVNQVTNPLGTFQYAYEGSTGRLANVILPNGMSTGFTYFDAQGQHRLKDITHARSDASPISTFSYTYDADGQIMTWTQQADVQAPRVYTFDYDAVGQLLQAQLTGPNGAMLREFVYGYDLAGNRTSERIDGQSTTATYNNGNQLILRNSAPAGAASIAKPLSTSPATPRTAPSGAKPKAAPIKSRPKTKPPVARTTH